MPSLTLPNPDVEFARLPNGDSAKINHVWYAKLSDWIKKTNQDSLSTNGRLTVTATSDTNLRFSYVGSDGITRTANLTLT